MDARDWISVSEECDLATSRDPEEPGSVLGGFMTSAYRELIHFKVH